MPSAVAQQVGGAAGDAITLAARSAFVDGMAIASLIGAAVAVGGAVVAALWLPARASGEGATENALEPTAAAEDPPGLAEPLAA